MTRTIGRAASTLLMLVMLAACGGSGSSLTSTTPGKVSPVSARTYPVKVSLFVPKAKAKATTASSLRATSVRVAATGRRPLYLPTSVNSVSIQQTESAGAAVTGATVVIVIGGPNCVASTGGQTCTVTLQGALGQDAWAVKSFLSGDGTGTVVSLNTGTLTVLQGAANVLDLTLDPILVSLVFVPTGHTVNATTAGPPLSLVLEAIDAAGAQIIGPGTFVTPANVPIPITLTSSSPAHAVLETSSGSAATTSISTTDDNDLADIAYDGTLVAGSQTVTASAQGIPTATFTLTITLAAGGLALPTSIAVGEDLNTTTVALNISEPGYGGTFDLTSTDCAGLVTFPANVGPGPTTSATVTQVGGGTCTISVTDGTNTGSVTVYSTTLGIVLQ